MIITSKATKWTCFKKKCMLLWPQCEPPPPKIIFILLFHSAFPEYKVQSTIVKHICMTYVTHNRQRHSISFLGRHRYGRPHNFLNDARMMRILYPPFFSFASFFSFYLLFLSSLFSFASFFPFVSFAFPNGFPNGFLNGFPNGFLNGFLNRFFSFRF